MNLNQVTLPATDIETSKRFYRRMGFTQIVDSPDYARSECPEGGATFSLLTADDPPAGGAVVYFETDRLDDLHADLVARGFVFRHGPRDERYLWREAPLEDPSGNPIVLYSAGENRRNPPWRVEIRDE